MNGNRLVCAALAGLIAGLLASCGSSSSDDGTKARAAENGLIAYEDDGQETWIMEPDGSGRHRLLKRGDEPSFSPDGKRIAYVLGVLDPSIDNYVPKLWVMNADGSSKQQVPLDINAATVDAHPDWAPNGKRIVFGGGPGEDVHIYSVKPDGSDLKQLTSDLDGSPVWSPDGKQIAFVRFNEATPAKFDMYVMNAEGSDEHKLTEGSDPAWSPDGKKIVFWNAAEIDVINADGSDRHTLVELAGTPAWSPDGKKIAFSSGEVGEPSNGLYVVNVDGSDKRQLIHTGFSSVQAISWQPHR